MVGRAGSARRPPGGDAPARGPTPPGHRTGETMTVTTPPGALIRDAEGLRLEFVRTFPDPIERVWTAITDPEELGTWFGTWRGDPSTGHVELSSMEGDGTFKST